jgi:hypothetical protein
MHDADDAADDAATDLIKAPDPFKKDTDWLTWSESLLTYTRSKKGQNNNTPLAYVLRERDVPVEGATYPTDLDEKIERTLLVGPQYAADNATMYDLLKSLAGNGPLWPFIQPFERNRNGRAAWKALVNFYEGDTMKARAKQTAYQAIAKSSYQGPRRNFGFSAYVTVHQRAH